MIAESATATCALITCHITAFLSEFCDSQSLFADTIEMNEKSLTQVVPNLHEFLTSVEHKYIYFEEYG